MCELLKSRQECIKLIDCLLPLSFVTCRLEIGDRFIQIGEWRIGDVDGRHRSFAHKKTFLINITRHQWPLYGYAWQ